MNKEELDDFIHSCYSGLEWNAEHASGLIHFSFYYKAALSQKDQNSKEFPESKSWFWMDIQDIFLHLSDYKEKSIVFEFAQILVKNNLPLPANTIIPTLDWAKSDPLLMDYIVPVLGNFGTEIVLKFEEYHKFNFGRKFNFQNYKNEKEKVFFVKLYFKYFKEIALDWTYCNWSNFSSKEKLAVCNAMTLHGNSEQNNIIFELLENENTILTQLALLSVLFVHNEEWQHKISDELFPQLNAAASPITLSLPNGKLCKLSVDKFISNFTTKWINHFPNPWDILESFLSKNLFPIFYQSIEPPMSTLVANTLFDFMLHKKRLTDQFPMLNLSKLFNHTEFNQNALKWLDFYHSKSSENIDLEAFYQFVSYEKHFWSDQLIEKILDLKTNSKLMKIYELEVFYQLLPFRINPKSPLAKNLEKEYASSIPYPLTFESILFFRNQLRRINAG